MYFLFLPGGVREESGSSFKAVFHHEGESPGGLREEQILDRLNELNKYIKMTTVDVIFVC